MLIVNQIGLKVSNLIYYTEHKAFTLDFNGRVDKGSLKNFQLVEEHDSNY